jgi:hypothetical protein
MLTGQRERVEKQAGQESNTRMARHLSSENVVSKNPSAKVSLTVYRKLVPGSYTIMAGGSSLDLPLHQQIALQ